MRPDEMMYLLHLPRERFTLGTIYTDSAFLTVMSSMWIKNMLTLHFPAMTVQEKSIEDPAHLREWNALQNGPQPNPFHFPQLILQYISVEGRMSTCIGSYQEVATFITGRLMVYPLTFSLP